ncbi:winged helix-turn-helix domain-containing protein [Phytohabitans houttuyneae]|uniref:Transcriptional regulator n=1 Tax=Phytohabitans houttuyneae TaxID=1076126 RepID=A0A6V8K790_9ACTN|nr:winged helix-turn-helix domain-containing protein [Phytohabitans houttuyneae]GFJ77989.1 transcriptional regulator [Phytohabitans houttuyneae]
MRIHFTGHDLAQTFLLDGYDAMWELVNSLQALQGGYGRTTFGAWRRRVAEDLRRSGLARVVRHQLFPVAPHAAYFPDLLTPPVGRLGPAAGIDAVLHTPARRWAAELGRLGGAAGAGAWLDGLRAGGRRALGELGATLAAYYRCAVSPHLEAIAGSVHDDLAARRGAAQDGGVEALLTTFRPMMRWDPPVLEVPSHPSRRDIHLEGRGLVLVPSYFCRLHPLTIFDPELPQVLVYPVAHRSSPPRLAASHEALVRLLGETRALVLLAAFGGATNGELARRIGVSTAAVSHHTTVLRDAGLLVSHRRGNTIRHSTSRLGAAMIRHDPDRPAAETQAG